MVYTLDEAIIFATDNKLEMKTVNLYHIDLFEFVDIIKGKVVYICDIVSIKDPVLVKLKESIFPYIDYDIVGITNDNMDVLLREFYLCEVACKDNYIGIFSKDFKSIDIFYNIMQNMYTKNNKNCIYNYDKTINDYFRYGTYKDNTFLLPTNQDIANQIINDVFDRGLDDGLNYVIFGQYNKHLKYEIIRYIATYYGSKGILLVNAKGLTSNEIVRALCKETSINSYSKVCIVVIENIDKSINNIMPQINSFYESSNIIRFFISDDQVIEYPTRVFKIETLDKEDILSSCKKIYPNEDFSEFINLVEKDSLVFDVGKYISRFIGSDNPAKEAINNYSKLKKEIRRDTINFMYN